MNCPDCGERHRTGGEAFDCDVAHGRLAGTVLVRRTRNGRWVNGWRTIDVLGSARRAALGYPSGSDDHRGASDGG